jgi:hypothetical protein
LAVLTKFVARARVASLGQNRNGSRVGQSTRSTEAASANRIVAMETQISGIGMALAAREGGMRPSRDFSG